MSTGRRLHALTRAVSSAIGRCELTHMMRQPIDVARARTEHRQYEEALAAAGCDVERLSAGSNMPDSVFIEDIALVFDQLAVLTRPGAPSRHAETPEVARVLERYRPVHAIESPATLDGGDVLTVGRHVFVARSARTNAAGIDQLAQLLASFGYLVTGVHVTGCLHLKSAVTEVADALLLINSQWVSTSAFERFRLVEVHPEEPYAANALRIGQMVVYPAAFPRTRERLERLGIEVRPVEASELAKAEGAVTCCSLVFTSA
jgi:dimethylargininase